MSGGDSTANRPDGRQRRRIDELTAHPLAGEVPALSEAEFVALKADIADRGLQVPLELTAEGVVLDGHARLRAAGELGLEEVDVEVVTPRDEREHIFRAALTRRQLSASQSCALAVLLAPYEELREQAKGQQRANLRQATEVATLPARNERTRDVIANLAGASPRTAQDVMTVHDHDPALFARVMRGEVSARTAASRTRRALRDAAIPAAPPLPDGPFDLILADPPWSCGSPDSPISAEQHYPTMTIAELNAMRIPAGEDCLLLMWAVNNLLAEAIELCSTWGFRYRSNLVWVKPSIGPGVWLRQRHELLLIATRGNFSPPEPEDRCDSVIEATRGRHSEKPQRAYELIEQMYPNTSRLELFARAARPGWAAWGNQLDPTP